ncbi:dihydrodipicolinate synthase family protein [Pseudothermotoga lettingae]|uniref:Dihydrodipicolinate synthetase n=2 Tax=Thermotogaceae TaxID=188709 RepID=A8F364_PSELT|nr:dihydrodipicolinate synthase family protein [Pseudothermotoga lettingae]ABV32598.1 dihydrodipicolinate synthetase [Pseudothermotoga lettingae TMO]GLI48415.1 4-hydroxy-tetrahydrodipicolinate synthase [Pseudothermotoga lettingae TMO]
MKRLSGVTVAALTPLTDDGTQVDHEAIKEYVDFLIQKGVHGIFALGTTGEGLLLTVEERKKALESFIKAVSGRATLIAHCGALRFEEVKELLSHAKSSGADGAAIVSPFYYKYRSDEIVEFFLRATENVEDFPIYLYNIPGLTGNWITPKIANQIHEKNPNIVGVKDSSGDLLHVLSLINDTYQDFDVVVGCDRAFLSILQMGAKGCVSGPAAVFPEFFVRLYEQFKKGDIEGARQTQRKLTKLSLALGDGASIPILKTVLSWRGINAGGCRSPLKILNETELQKLKISIETVLEEVKLTF